MGSADTIVLFGAGVSLLQERTKTLELGNDRTKNCLAILYY